MNPTVRRVDSSRCFTHRLGDHPRCSRDSPAPPSKVKLLGWRGKQQGFRERSAAPLSTRVQHYPRNPASASFCWTTRGRVQPLALQTCCIHLAQLQEIVSRDTEIAGKQALRRGDKQERNCPGHTPGYVDSPWVSALVSA